MALRIVEVSVTANHIALGKAKRCQECPIALAAYDTGAFSIPLVTPMFISEGDTHFGWAELPEVASQFIARFDRGEQVSPFTFSIEVEN